MNRDGDRPGCARVSAGVPRFSKNGCNRGNIFQDLCRKGAYPLVTRGRDLFCRMLRSKRKNPAPVAVHRFSGRGIPSSHPSEQVVEEADEFIGIPVIFDLAADFKTEVLVMLKVNGDPDRQIPAGIHGDLILLLF
jgi:hypothetical protein